MTDPAHIAWHFALTGAAVTWLPDYKTSNPFAALSCARGPILHRFSTYPTVPAYRDATAMLQEFARSCARDVLPLWEPPDVVREWLETGDELSRMLADHAATIIARETQDIVEGSAAFAAALSAEEYADVWRNARGASDLAGRAVMYKTWDKTKNEQATRASEARMRTLHRKRFNEMVAALFGESGE